MRAIALVTIFVGCGYERPPARVRILLDRMSIGATLIDQPTDLASVDVAFFINDPDSPSGVRRFKGTPLADGSGYMAEIPGGEPASVQFSLLDEIEDSYLRQWSFGSNEYLSLDGVFEHPDPEPAPPGAGIDVTLKLPTAYVSGETFQLRAIGPWVFHSFAAAELGAPDANLTTLGPIALDYTAEKFAPIAGTRAPIRITPADRIVAVRYTGTTLTASGEVAPFDMTDAHTPATVRLNEVVQSPLEMAIDVSAITARLLTVTPRPSTLAISWGLHASPAAYYAATTGVTLRTGNSVDGDVSISTTYGNPFLPLGWGTVFLWSSRRIRTYTNPVTQTTTTLSTGLVEYTEPASGATLDIVAGLPQVISVNDTPLTVDGTSLPIDTTKAVELSLTADRDMATQYEFSVYELVPSADGKKLDYDLAYLARALEPHITIPPGIFELGKTYTVRGKCVVGGYPNVATGDMRTRSYPYTNGYHDSGLFTVIAP